MGWLIDATKARGRTKLSLQALAARMWKEKGCPREDLKAESLANNLRKLDKGEMVDWWLGPAGKRYLPVLAAVLPMDPVELEASIRGARSVADDPERWFHFEVFPRLQAIDLDAEDPYPGVPTALLEEGGPLGRTWWHAPPGAGRTLVGRWLARRYEWTYGNAMSGSTPWFIEVEGPPSIVSLRARRVVVASPRPLPLELRAEGWLELRTPSDWQERLVRWVSDRVESGGRFDPEAVARWVREGHADAFETPGQVIELLACVDQHGVASLRGAVCPSDALAAWVSTHAARQDRVVGPASRAFLRDHGAGLIAEIELGRRLRGLSINAGSIEECMPAVRPAPSADTVIDLLDRGGEDAVRRGVSLRKTPHRDRSDRSIVITRIGAS